ncbi:MAG: 30S ribosomal protein S17 [Solirubrobacterales bacterium]
MADEEKNETTEETPEPEAPEAAAEETPAAEEAAGEAPAAEEREAPAADGGSGEDELEGLGWKARRRLLRSREPGEERPPQGGSEERLEAAASKRAAASRSRRASRAKQRAGHEAGEGTPPAQRESAGRKVRQGTVVSSKADKTITVRIDVARRHRTYEKIVRSSGTLHAHDESNEANEGDRVRIVETRPLSKTKRWRLTEVLEKAK